MEWIEKPNNKDDEDEEDEGLYDDNELHLVFDPDPEFEQNCMDESSRLKQADDEDTINPLYYKQSPMECIEAIEGLNLPFHEAQILKYIYRW